MSLIQKLLRIPHRPNDATTNQLKAYQLHRAYERLFMGKDNKLTPDARIVMADLCHTCGLVDPVVMLKQDGAISVEHTLINEGKRQTVLGMLRRIYKQVPIADGSPEEQDAAITHLIEEIQET